MMGIICAMQLEADGIVALSENVKTEEIGGMTFYTAVLRGREAVIVVCGEGKVNAAMCTAILIREYSPELIINSGVAGALSPIVSVGDIVVGSKAVEHDMNATAIGCSSSGMIPFSWYSDRAITRMPFSSSVSVLIFSL